MLKKKKKRGVLEFKEELDCHQSSESGAYLRM